MDYTKTAEESQANDRQKLKEEIQAKQEKAQIFKHQYNKKIKTLMERAEEAEKAEAEKEEQKS